MDFDQLETFLEVARLSSFSRAAEKRFRTQPAISSQIRSMEEEVGTRLLDRRWQGLDYRVRETVSEICRGNFSCPQGSHDGDCRN